MPAIDDSGARRRIEATGRGRAVISTQAWRELTAELSAGQATLLGLWGERAAAVHMAILARDPARSPC